MESRLIHNILDSVPGVIAVDVMVVTKMVTVRHHPTAISPAALVAALNSAGLQASLNKHSTGGGADAAPGHGTCTSSCCRSGSMQEVQQHKGLWHRLVPQKLRQGWAELVSHPSAPPLLVLASAALLLVNLVLLLPGLNAPALLQKGLLALVAACLGVQPVLRKAWAGLRNRNLDMNCLVSCQQKGSSGLDGVGLACRGNYATGSAGAHSGASAKDGPLSLVTWGSCRHRGS